MEPLAAKESKRINGIATPFLCGSMGLRPPVIKESKRIWCLRSAVVSGSMGPTLPAKRRTPIPTPIYNTNRRRDGSTGNHDWAPCRIRELRDHESVPLQAKAKFQARSRNSPHHVAPKPSTLVCKNGVPSSKHVPRNDQRSLRNPKAHARSRGKARGHLHPRTSHFLKARSKRRLEHSRNDFPHRPRHKSSWHCFH